MAESFLVWLVKTQYLRLFCMYLDVIKCNMNRNACCRYCCSTGGLEWQNLCVIHMRVAITCSKCSELKCTASIYTTQTVTVIELMCTDMLREACIFAEMHLTHITTREVSTALPAGVCLFATLQLTYTFFLPSNFTISCECALFSDTVRNFLFCCCLFRRRKSCN